MLVDILLWLSLTVLPLPTTRAAECAESGKVPYDAQVWDMRQALCGDGACNQQWSESTGNISCSMEMTLGGGWEILAFVQDTNNGGYLNWYVLFNELPRAKPADE